MSKPKKVKCNNPQCHKIARALVKKKNRPGVYPRTSVIPRCKDCATEDAQRGWEILEENSKGYYGQQQEIALTAYVSEGAGMKYQKAV